MGKPCLVEVYTHIFHVSISLCPEDKEYPLDVLEFYMVPWSNLAIKTVGVNKSEKRTLISSSLSV